MQWNEYGFKHVQVDHTLFCKRDANDITLILIYVDNMFVTCNNISEIEILYSYVSKEFEMKDLRNLRYFLGIEVSHSKQGLFSLSEEVFLRSFGLNW